MKIEINFAWVSYYLFVSSVAVYHLGWWVLPYCLLMSVHSRNSA